MMPCKEPMCTHMAVRHGRCGQHMSMRPKDTRTDRLYGRKAWKTIRLSILSEQPLCMCCKHHGFTTPATEVDHVIRHGGDWDIFVDTSMMQGLCAACHTRKTVRENYGEFYDYRCGKVLGHDGDVLRSIEI